MFCKQETDQDRLVRYLQMLHSCLDAAPVVCVVRPSGHCWHPQLSALSLYLPTGHSVHSPLRDSCWPLGQSSGGGTKRTLWSQATFFTALVWLKQCLCEYLLPTQTGDVCTLVEDCRTLAAFENDWLIIPKVFMRVLLTNMICCENMTEFDQRPD